jgi:uncharacterized protein
VFKFIVDENVGKLTKWLRIMGYDTLFFHGDSDSRMVATALEQDRVILTRDTHVLERRVVTSGRLKAILLQSEQFAAQITQVVESLKLDCSGSFHLCPEDNHILEKKTPEDVREQVPPYVFATQQQYRQCPFCRRIYWRGTHWQAMNRMLAQVCQS